MALQRSTQGAVALLVLGGVAILVAWLLLPVFKDRSEVATSDAATAKGTIRIASDNFVGYFPMCSPRMRQLMLADGWLLECKDDHADYKARFEGLKRGDYETAFAPIDAYVLAQNYAGVIGAVIDVSNGADGLVCDPKVASSIAELKQRLDIKVAYTPNSPSHHMAKVLGVDWDIPLFRGSDRTWRIETDGSAEAYKKLMSGDAQCAFLWEPDLSRAVLKGMAKVIDSHELRGVIVDSLVFERAYMDRHADTVAVLLANYWKTLKYYGDNPSVLNREVAQYASVDEKTAQQMVTGVSWTTLEDNATQWFGLHTSTQLGTYGLVDIIDRTVGVLKAVGDMMQSPFPNGDPRRIINAAAVTRLWNEGMQPGLTGGAVLSAAKSPLEVDFSKLDDTGWVRLKDVGALKVRPIVFQSGSNVLSLDDKRQLDETVEALKSYPNFRIEVQGHTPNGGDETANVTLTQERADAVKRYLEVTYNIDPDRIRAVGNGSSVPLTRGSDEAFRAFVGRQSRVEIHLKKEVY